jgi:dihydrofolate reductase
MMTIANDLTLIVAVGRNGEIGRAGGMPWSLPGDLGHFRAHTMGHVVIMGRTTFDTIGKALPSRTNLVVSKEPRASRESIHFFQSYDDALLHGRSLNMFCFAIGGRSCYEWAIPIAGRMIVTEVDGSFPDADTHFPSFDAAGWMVTTGDWLQGPKDTHRYRFLQYKRGSFS